ncbi:MAG: tRNA pseudouridine(38-40) synthase TruA [Lachnospiraceae bacterium]|nr:tRNA pseudouridine(38-40) synthase TruA [Lachnospiraceae bacterium]
MKNIRLVIEYDGGRYDGWQKQPSRKNTVSIQEKIEEVLSRMEEGEEISLIGGARTEPGAHAIMQIANFGTNSTKKMYEIKHYLNRYLPRDIAIRQVDEVPERFHSAFSAKKFVYEYRVETGEYASVFSRKYRYYCFGKPELARMEEAAKKLLGKHDFKGYSDNKRMKKSTERNMFDIRFEQEEGGFKMVFTADDFWPHMVRILAGTLLAIGLGEKNADAIDHIFEEGKRELAGEALDVKGLFLREIIYE